VVELEVLELVIHLINKVDLEVVQEVIVHQVMGQVLYKDQRKN
jgi:hypothetical protein